MISTSPDLPGAAERKQGTLDGESLKQAIVVIQSTINWSASADFAPDALDHLVSLSAL